MFTAAMHLPPSLRLSPIQTRWDGLFLPATRIKVAGARVEELDRFDEAELHVETTTIMFADVVESVRLIEQDELSGVVRIRNLLKVLSDRVVLTYHGRVLERRGDGLLVSFANTRTAVAFALEAHRTAANQEETHQRTVPIWLRIGIHSGSFLSDQVALYGKAINFAARISSLANPGETTLSSDARDELVEGLDGDLHDLGECYLKHMQEPVRAFRVQACAASGTLDDSAEALTPPTEVGLRPTIAVLPLVCDEIESTAATVHNFADVFAERLSAVLSSSSSVNVVASLSCATMRGRSNAVEHAVLALRADFVCRGTCALSSDVFVASIQILNAATMQVVWRSEVRGKQHEALSVNSDLIGRVAQAISEHIVSLALRSTQLLPLPNISSHALYLSAISTMHRFSRRDFSRALPMLEALHQRAPRHPDVLAWMARWHILRVVQGWSDAPAVDSSRAMSFSDQALSRDEHCALALTVRGSAEIGVRGDVDAAREMYRRALEQNPNESLAWLLSSVAEGLVGERGSALVASARAAQLAPLHPYGFYYDSLRSTAALFARDYQLAEQLARRSIRVNTMHGSAYRSLAIALGMQERWMEAETTVASLLQIEPNCTLDDVRRRYGNRADANIDFVNLLQRAGVPMGHQCQLIHTNE